LPGGDFPWDGLDRLGTELTTRYPFLTAATCERLVRSYGTRAAELLGDARDAGDLGRRLCTDLTEREVDWLRRREWAQTAADILWRRSKLGLRIEEADTAALQAYLDGEPGRALDRMVAGQSAAAAQPGTPGLH
jgi:glycerol-3-phosphate dehydrogenase